MTGTELFYPAAEATDPPSIPSTFAMEAVHAVALVENDLWDMHRAKVATDVYVTELRNTLSALRQELWNLKSDIREYVINRYEAKDICRRGMNTFFRRFDMEEHKPTVDVTLTVIVTATIEIDDDDSDTDGESALYDAVASVIESIDTTDDGNVIDIDVSRRW